jgi:hypothetical protein
MIFSFLFAFFVSAAYMPLQTTTENLALVEEGTFGSFEDAKRIYIDYQQRFFVADVHTHQVLMFTRPQAEPQMIGGYGWSLTSFDTPTGIAADGLNVYISDYGNRRIQRYDRSLNFISTWFLAGNNDDTKNCGYPLGVALSNSGEFFVLDGENNKIVKYSSDGAFDRSFGDIDAAEGKLQKPLKLLVSQAQQVYVLEPDRLCVYDIYGNFVQEIGKDILHQACGFCVAPDKIWAVSPDTLYCFSLDGRESKVLPIKKIISEAPLQNLRDIGCSENFIYLLTNNAVHRIRISR